MDEGVPPPGTNALPPGYSKGLRPAPLAEVDVKLDPGGEDDNDGPAGSLSAAGGAYPRGSSGEEPRPARGVLRVYRGEGWDEGRAPWACDERDSEFTRLVAVASPGGGTGAGAITSSGKQQREDEYIPLPGGMAVRLVTQMQSLRGHGGGEGEGDLLGALEEEAEEEGEELEVKLPGSSDGPTPLAPPFSLVPRRARKAGSSRESVVEVDCWGTWASRSVEVVSSSVEVVSSSSAASGREERKVGGGGGGGGGGFRVALGELARRMAQSAHLLASAEALGRSGRHGDAVRVLRRALGLVEPRQTRPPLTPAGGEQLQQPSPPSGGLHLPADAISPSQSSSSMCGPGLGRHHLLRMRLNAALLKAAVDEGSSWQVALEVRSVFSLPQELLLLKLSLIVMVSLLP